MRNISDISDLYNFKDICPLCEILENWFKTVNTLSRYNPRKCNLASALSGCIERGMSKVILALPTNNEVVEVL